MKKKILLFFSFILLSLGLLVGGCGSGSSAIMDDYSFGTQQFAKSGSVLTLTLPFEIGKANSSAQPNDITYGGSDQHINIIVIGETQKDNTPFASLDGIVSNAINNIKNVSDVSDVKYQSEPISVNGLEGRKISLTYTEKGMPLSVLQYVFVTKDVLWNIIYQYRTNDALGAELVKYLDGKIQITQQKEGQ